MERKVMIDTENKSKIIEYSKVFDMNTIISNNILNIANKVLHLDKVNLVKSGNEYLAFNEDKEICSFSFISRSGTNNYFIVKKGECVYEYSLVIKNKKIILDLTNVKINNDIFKCGIILANKKQIVYYFKDEQELYIEFDNKIKDEKELLTFIYNLNIYEDISKIYNNIIHIVRSDNISIKKSKIYGDAQKIVTDLITIENGKIVNYKCTIKKNGIVYLIEKNFNECVIKALNDSIESLNSIYFELNDQIDFVKKLERKK